MSAKILVDTGPIVAIFSEADEHHEDCLKVLGNIRGPLLTCWPVITEAAWMLRKNESAIALLMSSFGGSAFELAALDESDLIGIAKILERYQKLRLQLADASLLHLANREKIGTIFTLDRRDFGVMRTASGKKLRLIPEGAGWT